MGLLDRVAQRMHPVARLKPLWNGGDGIRDQAAGEIARLMAAHPVGDNPDIMAGQRQNGILVDLALEPDMGLGVVAERVEIIHAGRASFQTGALR